MRNGVWDLQVARRGDTDMSNEHLLHLRSPSTRVYEARQAKEGSESRGKRLRRVRVERQPTPLGGMETLVPRVQLLSHAADRRIAGGIADEGISVQLPEERNIAEPAGMDINVSAGNGEAETENAHRLRALRCDYAACLHSTADGCLNASWPSPYRLIPFDLVQIIHPCGQVCPSPRRCPLFGHRIGSTIAYRAHRASDLRSPGSYAHPLRLRSV